MVEISVNLKNLEDAGVLVPIKSPFNSQLWPLPKLEESWKDDSRPLQTQQGHNPNCMAMPRCDIFGREDQYVLRFMI